MGPCWWAFVRTISMPRVNRATKERLVSGLVDICEHTGTEVFATVDYGEQKLIARLPRSPMPVQGQAIQFAFSRDHLYLFDATRGKASCVGHQSERRSALAWGQPLRGNSTTDLSSATTIMGNF